MNILPSYYNKPQQVSCMAVQRALLQGWTDPMIYAYMFNVAKYLYRAPHKNGIEDLRKARTYLDFMINVMEGKDPYNSSEVGSDTQYEEKYNATT